MNSNRSLALLLPLSLLLAACEDDATKPDPPPPPPQITTTASYSYSLSTGLPDGDVYSILVTTTGQVWIGTANGIAVYASVGAKERQGDVINEINGPLPNRAVRKIVEYNNRVYVATWGGGIGIYDMGAGTWSSRGTSDGLPDVHVSDAVVLPAEDRVYFATNLGVAVYNPTANTLTEVATLDELIYSVEAWDNAGVYERWYGPRVDMHIEPADYGAHGITVHSGNTSYDLTLANCPLPEARVNDIYYDAVRDVYWLSLASTGIAEVSVPNSTWTFHTTVQGLPSNTVYSITRAEDRIWAGTQMGLARLKSDGTWQPYARSGGLQADRVRLVYSDDGQRLWLGFVNGGAARVDPNSAE